MRWRFLFMTSTDSAGDVKKNPQGAHVPQGMGRESSDIQRVGMVSKPQDKNRTDQ